MENTALTAAAHSPAQQDPTFAASPRPLSSLSPSRFAEDAREVNPASQLGETVCL